jgi:hypothetical protein
VDLPPPPVGPRLRGALRVREGKGGGASRRRDSGGAGTEGMKGDEMDFFILTFFNRNEPGKVFFLNLVLFDSCQSV